LPLALLPPWLVAIADGAVWEGVVGVAVAAMYTAFDAFDDLFIEGDAFDTWLDKDWPWPALLTAAVVLYVTVQALRKRTHLLEVPGR